MTKEGFISIAMILDRSGSMDCIRDNTIEGFNKFLSEQQKHPGKAVFTFVQFDHEYEVLHNFEDIQKIPLLTHETYIPRGTTALLDALGTTIDNIGKKLAQMPEDERPAQVVIAVLTDGLENHSKEYSRSKIFDMITHQTKVYQWEFVFLGANQDSIQVGKDYGFKGSNSLTYATDEVSQTLTALSNKMTAYRDLGDCSMDFFDETDRTDLG